MWLFTLFLSLSLHTILISSASNPSSLFLPFFITVFVVYLLFFPFLSFLQEGGKNEEAAKVGGKRGFSFRFLGPVLVDPLVFLSSFPVLLSFGMSSSSVLSLSNFFLLFCPFFLLFLLEWWRSMDGGNGFGGFSFIFLLYFLDTR